ncbi:MAG: homocysteine S-methyltransferase family protein, partial [Cyclobacteriaceae bacterium]|nr:homocysteine S-methyltransferase family protein [Cyclobacteriaceae bacterium]
SDGTPIEKCAAIFTHHPIVFAIGINCTSPEFISELIRSVKPKSGNKKIVVYPNSGAVYHAESKTWSGLSDLSSCELMVKEWMELGADIIGGCCGIGPQQIIAMGRTISKNRFLKTYGNRSNQPVSKISIVKNMVDGDLNRRPSDSDL